jgi:hypothetical protein
MVHEGPATLKLIAWGGDVDYADRPGIPVVVRAGGEIDVDMGAYWQVKETGAQP